MFYKCLVICTIYTLTVAFPNLFIGMCTLYPLERVLKIGCACVEMSVGVIELLTDGPAMIVVPWRGTDIVASSLDCVVLLLSLPIFVIATFLLNIEWCELGGGDLNCL